MEIEKTPTTETNQSTTEMIIEDKDQSLTENKVTAITEISSSNNESNQASTEINHSKLVGRRIDYNNSIGSVKYCGYLKHVQEGTDTTAVWLGIQWDDITRGKHNGTVKDVQYFVTDDGKDSGSLIRLDKANLGINIYDGIIARYFKNEKDFQANKTSQATNDKNDIEYDEEAYFETIKKFKKRVEFIGFNKIWQKINDLKNIKELSLPELHITDLGPEDTLTKVMPNVKNLSLEKNLLFDWHQVYQIGRELKNLEWLSISGNKFNHPEDVRSLDKIYIHSTESFINENPIGVFEKLKTIILINMNLTWKTFQNVLPCFKNVEELILCRNSCNDFQNLVLEKDTFQNLVFLNLEENGISSFEGLNVFKDLPKLSKLTLNKNELSKIGKIEGFLNIKSISLDENKFMTYKVFSELNQFPQLQSLRLAHNPVNKANNILYTRQRALADIKNLRVFNNSELKKYEKQDSEIYYLRKSFEDYFQVSKQNAEEYDFDNFLKFAAEEYPRIPEFIKAYGNPYEIVPKKQIEEPKFNAANDPVLKMKAGLLSLKLNALTGAHLGKPAVTKKFTDNTLLTNLRVILAKHFGLPGDKLKIFFKNHPKDSFTQMEDDLKSLYFYGVKNQAEIWVDVQQ